MCANTMTDQAIVWVWENLWDMLQYDHNEFRVLMTIDDLVHLENTTQGKIGYDPRIIGDFPIGL